MENLFTDQQSALEEMKYLADDENRAYAVVSVLMVVEYEEARQRDLVILETCTPTRK